MTDERLDRGELQDRAIRGAVWTLIHTAVSLPLAFGVNIVLARVLGIADYGRLAFLTIAIDIAGGVISLGIGAGLVQFGAKAHAVGRPDAVRALLSKTQGFRLMVEAPVLVVVVSILSRDDPSILILAVIFGILLPAALGGAGACLAIENRTAVGAKNAMVVNVLSQVAVLTAVFTIGTAVGVWSARLIVVGLGIAISLFFVSPGYRRAILRPTIPRRFPQGFWQFALPVGVASLLGSLVVSRTEVLALTWLSTPAAVGTFALAFGLAGHLFSPAQALIGPLVPAISGLREVDEGAVVNAFTRTLRASSTIVAVLLATVLPGMALLVPTIYGPEYKSVPPVMLVLGLASGCLVVASPVQAFVQARLSGKRVLAANAFALLMDVVLAVALIPPLGVWGAVVANAGAAATLLGFLLTNEIRELGLGWGAVANNASPLFLGSIACGVAWCLGSAVDFGTVGNAAFAAGSGFLVVGAGLRATRTGLSPKDTAAVMKALPAGLNTVSRPFMWMVTARSQRS